MTHLYASAMIGTAAALLTMFLLLMRTERIGRHLAVVLTRGWRTTNPSYASFVLAALTAIAVASFSFGSTLVVGGRHGSDLSAADIGDPQDADDVAALRNFADAVDGKQHPTVASANESDAATLPAVDMMIAKLIARLKEQPNDVKGWKTLGWSYLNTDRPQDAVEAYETALKLDPSDADTKKALEAAQKAESTATKSTQPVPP